MTIKNGSSFGRDVISTAATTSATTTTTTATITTSTRMSSPPVKRRRKQVKSCLFCRKRKLRCNKLKPMCQQCQDRKLPTCVYMDEYSHVEVSLDDVYDKYPNVELLQRINELENKIRVLKENQTITPPYVNNLPEKTRNPLATFKSGHWKQGQLFVFGPTSWRSILTADGTKFQLEFINLWNKLKPRYDPQTLQSQDLFRAPLNTNVTFNQDGMITETSMIQLVCRDLPKFSKVKWGLEQFFNGPFHELLHILDKEKTWRDFYELCHVDQNTDRITDIIVPEDGNVFRFGIILSITILSLYPDPTWGKVPESFIRYCILLNGTLCLDSNYTERAQYMLLICFYKIHNGEYSRWDGTQTIDIISHISAVCINMGFNNINKWYRNKESTCGDLKYLGNVMIWTLFIDIIVSFDVGKPLSISDQAFCFVEFEKSLNSWDSVPLSPRHKLFLEFIKIGRQCINNLNSEFIMTQGNDDIDTYILQLQEFLNKNFPQLDNYTQMGTIFSVDPFEIVVLAPTLGMLFNFHNIKRAFYKDISISTKNGMAKYGLLATSLCVNTLLSMFEADKIAYPELVKNATYLTPYLNLSLTLVSPVFSRVISELYSVFMARLTLQEKGYVVLTVKSNHGDEMKISLNDSQVARNNYYCFLCVIKQFSDILDQLFNPEWKDLQNVMSTSYSLHSLMMLERVARQLLNQGLSSREQMESHWKDQGVDLNQIPKDLLTTFTNEVWDDYASNPKNMWTMGPQEILDMDLDLPLDHYKI